MTRNFLLERFIEKARKVHGDKYDYSKVIYTNCKIKVCIICPIHGEFWQTPDSHIQGSGCIKCANELASSRQAMQLEEFIRRGIEIHGTKYNYSKVNYINAHTKVCIICPIHGDFYIEPRVFLRGCGCQKCGRTFHFTTTDFIQKAKEIHGNKYDYSKVKYVDYETKVCIICPVHGEFWQTPHSHLVGCGCQYCKTSKLENEIKELLNKNNIDYIYNTHEISWLKPLTLDFFIPNKNIAIECQGIQHFKIIEHFGGKDKFDKLLDYDKKKYELCKENGIKLLYYSNLGIEYPYKVYEDKDKLLKEILT